MQQAKYIDGDYATPVLVDRTDKVYPFFQYGDTSHSTFTETYIVDRTAYVPLVAGTQHGSELGHYMVAVSAPEREGRDKVRYTCTYASVPTPISTYSSYEYNRPGGAQFSFSADQNLYGTEETGNAGLIRRIKSDTYDLYTYRSVLTDTGVSTDPTGGTWTITIGAFGTTAAIAYNANAAAIKLAIDNVIPAYLKSDVNAVTWNDINGADFSIFVQYYAPQITIVTGGDALSISGNSLVTREISFPSVFLSGQDLTYTTPTFPDNATDIRLIAGPAFSDKGGYYEWRPYGSTLPRGEKLGVTARVLTPPIWGYRQPGYTNVLFATGEITGGTVYVSARNGAGHVDVPFDPANVAALSDGINDALESLVGAEYGYVGTAINVRGQFTHYVHSDNIYDGSWAGRGGDGYTDRIVDKVEIPLNTKWKTAPRRALPASYSWKVSFAHVGGIYATDEVTFDQDTTEAEFQTGLESLQYWQDAGYTPDATLTSTSNGVRWSYGDTYPQPPALSFTSSLTPSPSEVRLFGSNSISLVAAANPRIITTAQPHGLTGADKIVVRRGSAYTYYERAAMTVLDEYRIQVEPSDAAWRDGTLVTGFGKFITRYQQGLASFVARDVTEYYLPGAAGQVASVFDIGTAAPQTTSSEFFDAHFTDNDGFIDVETGELEYYLGPIISRKKRQIRIK